MPISSVAHLNVNRKLLQIENPAPNYTDTVYVSSEANVTATRDGSESYPYSTWQEAIDHYGDPTSSADYNRIVRIKILGRSSYVENIVLPTRRWVIEMEGATLVGTVTMNISNALRFGSTNNPGIEFYSATRIAGSQILGAFSVTLTGTAVTNLTIRATNVLFFGNWTIADGVNGGSSVTSGSTSTVVLAGASIVGHFLGRNMGVALADTASVTGNIEWQALISCLIGILLGTSIKQYGTSTTNRDIIGMQLLSTGGVTWENVNASPRWVVDNFSYSQLKELATVTTNQIIVQNRTTVFPAGTTTTPSIKIEEGDLTTVAEDGALEHAENTLFFSPATDRRTVMLANEPVTTDVTVANTTTETEIYDVALAANSLRAGKRIYVWLAGLLATANASDTATIRVYLGATLIGSVTSVAANVSDEPWHIESSIQIRSLGGSGTAVYHIDFFLSGSSTHSASSTPVTIDTTTTNDISVTVEWDNADAGNSLVLTLGDVQFIN